MNATPKKVLLLFANSTVRSHKADPEALQTILNEASLRSDSGIEFYFSYARSLSYFVSNEKSMIRDHRNHLNLDEYDFVYFRKAGAAMQQMQAAALFLREHGIPFYDSELIRANSRNKLSQMFMLQQKGLPIAKTLFCRNNRRLLRLVTRRYAGEFSFPLIAKATGGTRGDANYLVKDAEELKRIVTDEKRHFMIQEYIPNDGDFRFFIAGGVLRGVIGRKASGGTHLSNTSKGATADILSTDQFSDEVRAQAVYSAQIFGRDVAGVDIMFDKRDGQHYFLEVNRAPQIEHASFEAEKGDWLVSAIKNSINTHQVSSHVSIHGEKQLIGRFETVKILPQDSSKKAFKVIAKIDTGADISSLHCQDIKVEKGILSCKIGDRKYKFEKFFEKGIRSSNGTVQKRYMVGLDVQISEKAYSIKVTLNDRSDMRHEMLIGRRFLRANHFLVEVGRRFIQSGKKPRKEQTI